MGLAGTAENNTVRVPAPVKEHTSGERGAPSRQRHGLTSHRAEAVVEVNSAVVERSGGTLDGTAFGEQGLKDEEDGRS